MKPFKIIHDAEYHIGIMLEDFNKAKSKKQKKFLKSRVNSIIELVELAERLINGQVKIDVVDNLLAGRMCSLIEADYAKRMPFNRFVYVVESVNDSLELKTRICTSLFSTAKYSLESNSVSSLKVESEDGSVFKLKKDLVDEILKDFVDYEMPLYEFVSAIDKEISSISNNKNDLAILLKDIDPESKDYTDLISNLINQFKINL